MNLKVSASCDYSQFMIGQKLKFTNAISKAWAIILLESIADNSSAEINRIEANINDSKIRYKLDNVGVNYKSMDKSLRKKYQDAIKAIQFDMSKIDEVCLDCNRRRSIRIRNRF